MSAVDWLMPVGPGEDLQQAGAALRSIIGQAPAGDRILIVCEERQFDDLMMGCGGVVRGVEVVRVEAPAMRSAGAFRNCGLEYVRGDVVIFHDADDIALPGRRDVAVRALDERGDAIFSGSYYLINGAGETIGKRDSSGPEILFWLRSNIFLPTVAITSTLARKHRFTEDLAIGEDTVFFADCLREGASVIRSATPVIKYRISSDKASRKRGVRGLKNEAAARWQLLKRATIAQSVMVCCGAFAASMFKLLPSRFFVKVYRWFHGG